MSVLEFLDERVFRCRWRWLCRAHDRQIRAQFRKETTPTGGTDAR